MDEIEELVKHYIKSDIRQQSLSVNKQLEAVKDEIKRQRIRELRIKVLTRSSLIIALNIFSFFRMELKELYGFRKTENLLTVQTQKLRKFACDWIY